MKSTQVPLPELHVGFNLDQIARKKEDGNAGTHKKDIKDDGTREEYQVVLKASSGSKNFCFLISRLSIQNPLTGALILFK